MKRVRLAWILAGLSALLVLSIVLATGMGSTSIPAGTVFRIVWAHLFASPGAGKAGSPSLTAAPMAANAATDAIVWLIRLPRVLLAGIVGASLAMVGVALQAVTSNRLADPHLLGVSGGATLGAVIATLFLGAIFGPFTLSLLAFAGAVLATLMVIVLAHRHGRLDPDRLLLSGVTVSFVLLASANLLLYLGDQRAAASILFWSLGGLGLARWSVLPIPAVVALGGGLLLLIQRRGLDAVMTGDLTAVSLGISVGGTRRDVFLISALMTSAMVAVSGAIGFVGLVTPHLCRPIVGPSHARLLPVAALVAAILLIWGDVAARLLIAPEDLPIGVVTALLGGAACLFLMRFDRRRDG